MQKLQIMTVVAVRMLAARKLDVQFKLGDILSSYSVYPGPFIKHWIRDKLWQIDDLLNK